MKADGWQLASENIVNIYYRYFFNNSSWTWTENGKLFYWKKLVSTEKNWNGETVELIYLRSQLVIMSYQ